MSPIPSFLVVSALFAAVFALERIPALQYRPAGMTRQHMLTDGAWYVVATVANVISAFVFRPQLATLAIPGVAEPIGQAPLVVQLGLGIVVYDLVAFAVHVAIHRFDVLWSVHKVHHSTLLLDGLATTRTHLFEHLVRNVPAQAALFALGLPASTVATTLVIYAAFALHGHSNLRIGGRGLELIFVTPRLHRLHHLPATTQRNFGTVFTLWDRIFGRLVVRDAGPEERTGVPGEIDRYPQRFADAFRQPGREVLARRVRNAGSPRSTHSVRSEHGSPIHDPSP